MGFGKITTNHNATLKKNHIHRDEYIKLKQKHLDFWRPIIFKRDGFRCVNCGETKNCNTAHITPCFDFVKKYDKKGIEMSFREDNLVTLCKECHIDAQHAMLKGFNISGEMKERARKVFKLFEEKITERGWRTLIDLNKPIKKTSARENVIVEKKEKIRPNKKYERQLEIYGKRIKPGKMKKWKKSNKMKKWCRCNNCKELFRPGWGLQLGNNKFKCPMCGQESVVTYSFGIFMRD